MSTCTELSDRMPDVALGRAAWTETEQRSSTPPGLRSEARCRANEAAVLADALRTRSTP